MVSIILYSIILLWFNSCVGILFTIAIIITVTITRLQSITQNIIILYAYHYMNVSARLYPTYII